MTDKSRNDDEKKKADAELRGRQKETGGRPESPEVDVTGHDEPDAHRTAAANVMADADAGASDDNNGGTKEIPGADDAYAKGKDPSKHKTSKD